MGDIFSGIISEWNTTGKVHRQRGRREKDEQEDLILKSEFDEALEEMRTGKAVGVDQIARELLKNVV